MSRRYERFRELCAGLVLGTLSEDERWELDELLATASPEMLGIYRELEVAALHLPAAAELVEPPPEVRGRILEAIRAEQRSVIEEDAVAQASKGAREGIGARFARWLGLTRPGLALAAVASLVIVSVGLGLYSSALYRAAGEQQRRALDLAEDLRQKERLLQVLRSPHLEVVALDGIDPNTQAHGKLIWDRENQVAVLQVGNLPPISEGKIYQLWVFARDRDPTSAGVFAVRDTQRDAFFRFEGFTPVDRRLIRGYLVTLEPEGGAAAPSESWYLGARVETEDSSEDP